jgi:hypothetical protein
MNIISRSQRACIEEGYTGAEIEHRCVQLVSEGSCTPLCLPNKSTLSKHFVVVVEPCDVCRCIWEVFVMRV